jgi:multidrug efflux pump subunit AcrB
LEEPDLNLIDFIGIIVKKSAIMMIDFALEAGRNEGKHPLEAIHQACLPRFVTNIMTTMCAIVAGLPLALGRGTFTVALSALTSRAPRKTRHTNARVQPL